jgi:hypothetical protein
LAILTLLLAEVDPIFLALAATGRSDMLSVAFVPRTQRQTLQVGNSNCTLFRSCKRANPSGRRIGVACRTPVSTGISGPRPVGSVVFAAHVSPLYSW